MRLRKNEINSKFSLTFLIYGINFDIYDMLKLIVYCFYISRIWLKNG